MTEKVEEEYENNNDFLLWKMIKMQTRASTVKYSKMKHRREQN